MNRFIRLMLMVLWIVPIFNLHAQSAGLPAFPGAEGFGAVATGGRGGQVITVTNLNADGEGSLQAALDTQGARTIVFAVSGVIPAIADIRYGDVTIAGQTSPGGITVRGILCDGHYEVNDCDNLIIQHLRSRPAAHLMEGEAQDDALRLDGVENVMIDHVSLANATDETVQISMARNVTIQNSIFAEPIGDHSLYGGMLLNYSHSQRPQDNISIHHNLWYRVEGRLPEISCELTRGFGEDEAPEVPSFCAAQPLHLDVRYNLYWDAGYYITYNDNADANFGEPGTGLFTLEMNFIGNRMFVRPDHPYGMIDNYVLNQPGNRIYMQGNTMNIYPDAADTQLAYCCNDFPEYHPNTESSAAEMLDAPHAFPMIAPLVNDSFNSMYAIAGALPVDPMDARIRAEIQEGLFDGVFADMPYGVGTTDDAFALAFDPSQPPLAPMDSDGDGMPDAWETEHGLDANVYDPNGTGLSAQVIAIPGYTDLEVYLDALSNQLEADCGCGGLPLDG